MADYTMCSARTEVCPITEHCQRAAWRDGRPLMMQSFADFSEEIIHDDTHITCPFFMDADVYE